MLDVSFLRFFVFSDLDIVSIYYFSTGSNCGYVFLNGFDFDIISFLFRIFSRLLNDVFVFFSPVKFPFPGTFSTRESDFESKFVKKKRTIAKKKS